jgi:hypothetical protein
MRSGGKEASGFTSFSKGTTALASKLKGTSCLSAISATWRLWDEKKVEVNPAYISVTDLQRGLT